MSAETGTRAHFSEMIYHLFTRDTSEFQLFFKTIFCLTMVRNIFFLCHKDLTRDFLFLTAKLLLQTKVDSTNYTDYLISATFEEQSLGHE